MASMLETSAMNRVNAKRLVGKGFPTDEGEELARALLGKADLDFYSLTVDLTHCDSALLISAFFNAFLQEIFNQRPDLLDVARKIDWELEFDFQRENVGEWMHDFQPYLVH